MNNLIKIILFSTALYCTGSFAEERKMSEEQAQEVWNEYHERIKNRRLAQVNVLNEQLKNADVTNDTQLILDFEFFTPKESGAEAIKKQLSENYEISIQQDDDYWIISGTTRPYAITLSPEQHIGWVEFMHDVALSYGCIFSVWTITEPKSKQSWSNKNIETEFD